MAKATKQGYSARVTLQNGVSYSAPGKTQNAALLAAIRLIAECDPKTRVAAIKRVDYVRLYRGVLKD